MDAKDLAKNIRAELKEKSIKAKVRVFRYKRGKDLVSVDFCCLSYSYDEIQKIKDDLDLHKRYTDKNNVVY